MFELFVILAKAGTHSARSIGTLRSVMPQWVPAFAGMTRRGGNEFP